MTKKKPTAGITIRIEPEVKERLEVLADRKGMDLTKLTRAILTNYVKPNSYQL